MSAVPPTSPPRRASSRSGLKGILAIIFWCACGITATQIAWPFTLIASAGPSATFSAIVDALSGDTLQAQILRYGIYPQLALFAWSASFVVFTVMRLRVAITLSPILMAAWVAVSIACQIGIRAAISPDGLSVDVLPALIPTVLGQVVGAAAFWAYLKQATAPLTFFTR